MFRKICFITLSLIVFLISTPLSAWSNPSVVIDKVPRIGAGDTITGHVRLDKKGDFSHYKISMALEVNRGEQIWAPKPTAAEPDVKIDSNGKFSCKFVSGGNDRIAERLYVYLIPAAFTPGENAETTDKAALDVIIIDRFKDRVDIRSKYPAALKHPKDTKKLSLNYSPYTEGLSPQLKSPISAEHIRRQLALIHPYSDTIKIFGVSGELNKIYKIAKNEFNFRIIGGCWIDRYSTEQDIRTELDTLINLVDNGYIDIALVGSETLYRNDLPVTDLVKYIKYVRSKITKKVPIGTSDSPYVFIDNPVLVQASDIVCCTIYPFFSSIPVNNAAQNMTETYNRVVNAVNNEKIAVIISESGWPQKGTPVGAAVPSAENSRRYLEDIYRYSRRQNVEFIWFESFSEPWKSSAADYEAYFGLFTSDERLEEQYRPLLETILDTYSPEESNSSLIQRMCNITGSISSERCCLGRILPVQMD